MQENRIDISFEGSDLLAALWGEGNSNLKILERLLKLNIGSRGSTLMITGDPHNAQLARQVLEELYGLIKEGYSLYPYDVEQAVKVLGTNRKARLKSIFLDKILISSQNRVISPKSINQKDYIEAMRHYDLVFAIGPAGTGKTYLAMAMALGYLSKARSNRIVLVRPAVEAGEKLGYLPGDLYQKVNPYLRPLYDALYDMVDYEKASRLVERGTIEVAPLAFMRGRTLNDSFVILDEAQNTTSEQMKMFLTRLGLNSKAVITGDITQVDLPGDKISGLIEARNIIEGIEGIKFVYFSEVDVVRHPLVQEIIRAYEKL